MKFGRKRHQDENKTEKNENHSVTAQCAYPGDDHWDSEDLAENCGDGLGKEDVTRACCIESKTAFNAQDIPCSDESMSLGRLQGSGQENGYYGQGRDLHESEYGAG